MRRTLIASLLLSPALFTVSAIASQPVADDAAAPAQNLSVSTGVTAPALIYSTPVEVSNSSTLFPTGGKVVLTLKVDEKGKPNDIQVVNPVNPILDEEVTDAVSKFLFKPATLDKQAVPVDLNLTVEVTK